MPLDPQCKAFLDQLAVMGGPPLHEMAPADARARVLPPDLAGPERPIHRVDNRAVPGRSGPVRIRVYTPVDRPALPALVYCHGGGFVLGGLDMCDRVCRELAIQSGCAIVSIDYRLAPEHKFPAAADDVLDVTRYVAERPHEFGIDPQRLAVGGESAGGNLAAVTALRARDEGGPRLAFQLLIYPLVDFADESPSMREFAEGHFLGRADLDYFRDHYLPGPADRSHAHASPLLAADLSALPPALVMTAECDPLRDQGEGYADRLERSGVPVVRRRYAGMIHPFFSLAGIIDGGRTAIADAAAELRRVLQTPAQAQSAS